MTREEAIAVLGNAKYELSNQVSSKYCRAKYEAIDMAIKALQQEPTTKNDLGVKAVSKQAVIDTILEECSGTKLDIDFAKVLVLQRAIKALPLVTPQEPKTGHWIRVTDKTGHLVWECDKCSWQQRFNTDFCIACGAKMIEPQKSKE